MATRLRSNLKPKPPQPRRAGTRPTRARIEAPAALPWRPVYRLTARPLGIALTTLFGAAAAAGCGSSHSTSGPPLRGAAPRVCAKVDHAARRSLGQALQAHIVDSDPANIECLVTGRALRVDVTAQAMAQAWNHFDTKSVHQSQAYGASAQGDASLLPQDIVLNGANAAWIAAQKQLIATNGTQSRGGSYVTVTVAGARASAAVAFRVAKAVGEATLASAPWGPSPGPAPS